MQSSSEPMIDHTLGDFPRMCVGLEKQADCVEAFLCHADVKHYEKELLQVHKLHELISNRQKDDKKVHSKAILSFLNYPDSTSCCFNITTDTFKTYFVNPRQETGSIEQEEHLKKA